MAKNTKHSLPDISEWLVLQLRFTVFPTPSAKLLETKWWSELLGAEPDTRTVRPGKAELLEEGELDHGQLSLKVVPVRIDWTYTKKNSADIDAPILPTLGSFTDAGDKFTKLMGAWLSLATSPSMERIAFGAILHQPAKSRKDGYEQLSRYLPSVDLSLDSRDFLLQINRPRQSRVQDFKTHAINRLTKWSCVSYHRRLVTINAEGPVQPSVVGNDQYAIRLELDLSTPADWKRELPRATLPSLLGEQYSMAKEIASKGDIP